MSEWIIGVARSCQDVKMLEYYFQASGKTLPGV